MACARGQEHQNFPRQALIKLSTPPKWRATIPNDIDLVQLTQYIVPENRVAK
jgi:hypothetical protein